MAVYRGVMRIKCHRRVNRKNYKTVWACELVDARGKPMEVEVDEVTLDGQLAMKAKLDDYGNVETIISNQAIEFIEFQGKTKLRDSSRTVWR